MINLQFKTNSLKIGSSVPSISLNYGRNLAKRPFAGSEKRNSCRFSFAMPRVFTFDILPALVNLQGGESKGNLSEEPTCTRTTFQGALTQGLGKCMISFLSKGIMSNEYFKSIIYETQNRTVLSRLWPVRSVGHDAWTKVSNCYMF